jgi:hypothetical protein
MPTLFQHFPNQPTHTACQSAFVILCNAHDAASSFLEIFGTVRTNRNARGMATDEEQDLLRAMLSFASAGIDSMAKQVIRDALPTVLHSNEPASQMFKSFIERKLKSGEGLDHKLLADVLGDRHPRGRLVQVLVDDLTSRSLQSTEEILKAAATFDIRSAEITQDPRRLTEVFRVRNQIAHEMDVDFTRPNRSRRPRARDTMVAHTNEIFAVANAFLVGVDRKLDA